MEAEEPISKWHIVGNSQPAIAGFKDGSGRQAKDCGHFPEDGEGKEIGFPPELQ